MSDKHPDLLALVEGRLPSEQSHEAQNHLEGCDACRRTADGLRQALAAIDASAQSARMAFGDPVRLAAEADQWLGDLDLEQPAELVLAQDQVVESLPSELRRKTAGLRQESLGARLKRSVERLTGLGANAARELAERLGSGAAPAAAPAIRKDATKVDDHEPGEDDKQGSDPQ